MDQLAYETEQEELEALFYELTHDNEESIVSMSKAELQAIRDERLKQKSEAEKLEANRQRTAAARAARSARSQATPTVRSSNTNYTIKTNS